MDTAATFMTPSPPDSSLIGDSREITVLIREMYSDWCRTQEDGSPYSKFVVHIANILGAE
jgi:hypothetical protein